MSDGERTERIGRNEALYRQVNERLEDLNESFEPVAGDFVAVCECGKLECFEQFAVPREVYERTRANADWFLVRPTHGEEDLERVVERHEGFWIVEKLPGEPRRLAKETDPRSHDVDGD